MDAKNETWENGDLHYEDGNEYMFENELLDGLGEVLYDIDVDNWQYEKADYR